MDNSTGEPEPMPMPAPVPLDESAVPAPVVVDSLYSDLYFPDDAAASSLAPSLSSINVMAEREKYHRQQIQEQVDVLTKENTQLTAQLKAESAKNAALMQKYSVLILNISRLFRTAQEEINKKNQHIQFINDTNQAKMAGLMERIKFLESIGGSVGAAAGPGMKIENKRQHEQGGQYNRQQQTQHGYGQGQGQTGGQAQQKRLKLSVHSAPPVHDAGGPQPAHAIPHHGQQQANHQTQQQQHNYGQQTQFHSQSHPHPQPQFPPQPPRPQSHTQPQQPYSGPHH